MIFKKAKSIADKESIPEINNAIRSIEQQLLFRE